MKAIKVSVVIPTRNRYQSLIHSLGSLLTQSKVPAEIIVVDNGSRDQTKEVVGYISKNSKISIKYVLEKSQGYPFVYNKGLESAANDWVAFLDDDCIASYDWYQNIVAAISKSTQVAVFLGKYQPDQPNHILGLTENFINNLGLTKINKNKEELDFEILDSKNTIYNKKFLVDNQIRFDESLMLFGNGSSEDCDLGMQVQQAGGQAVYDPEIIIYHKDVMEFIPYYKKLISRTKDHLAYEKKWQKYRSKMGFKRVGLVNIFKSLKTSIQGKELGFIKSLLMVINVFLSFIIKKIISIIYA